MRSPYAEITNRFLGLCTQNNLLEQRIEVHARALSTEEAIGNPEDQDYPLQTGKERLMQAGLMDGQGQAFTDRFGDFQGTLREVLEMPLENNFRRAVFVAALNAVTRHLGLVDTTIHCRDEEPGQCARQLNTYLMERFGKVRITQVGFQPRMAQILAEHFPFRLLDLDPDNIGTRKFGVTVEGADKTAGAVAWADVLLVTGTTLVNDTIGQFLTDKPVVFYGTTIAGAAHLMGWDRFCAEIALIEPCGSSA